MDVGQTFLNDPKDGDFHFVWQPAEIAGDFQIHLNIAAFREAIHIPAKGRGKAGDIEEWWMKQMRNRANLARNLFDQVSILRNGSGSERIELMGLSLNYGDVHAESCQHSGRRCRAAREPIACAPHPA